MQTTPCKVKKKDTLEQQNESATKTKQKLWRTLSIQGKTEEGKENHVNMKIEVERLT